MDAATLEMQLTASFETGQGIAGRGDIIRFSRFEVVFEAYKRVQMVQVSEAFNDFKILHGDKPIYSGRATVKSVVDTGLVWICEVTLEDGWLDVDYHPDNINGPGIQNAFATFMSEWQKQYCIVPEYKVVVADMQTYLMDLRSWLEQVEWGIRSSPSEDRLKLEQEITKSLGEKIVPVIDGLFKKFETVTEIIPPDQLPAHRSYMKRQLHSLMLCSPFAWRIFKKPLGYAGDYEMINMIAFEPLEGSSLFAKIVNFWFLKQPPAEAHRNRLSRLQQILVQETAQGLQRRRPVRILSLGCGPAVEVQRFLKDSDLSNDVHFTLLDFNEETVLHVQSVIEKVKQTHGRGTSIQVTKKSVNQILKESGRQIALPPDQQYDLVYCAGLLDYLPDHICQRLLTILYAWVIPGGLLLATNADASNPSRNGMEHLVDWHLLYRDTEQAERLLPTGASPEDVAIDSEISGINIFLNVRKPLHGA